MPNCWADEHCVWELTRIRILIWPLECKVSADTKWSYPKLSMRKQRHIGSNTTTLEKAATIHWPSHKSSANASNSKIYILTPRQAKPGQRQNQQTAPQLAQTGRGQVRDPKRRSLTLWSLENQSSIINNISEWHEGHRLYPAILKMAHTNKHTLNYIHTLASRKWNGFKCERKPNNPTKTTRICADRVKISKQKNNVNDQKIK